MPAMPLGNDGPAPESRDADKLRSLIEYPDWPPIYPDWLNLEANPAMPILPSRSNRPLDQVAERR
jgi:hypothetical protein